MLPDISHHLTAFGLVGPSLQLLEKGQPGAKMWAALLLHHLAEASPTAMKQIVANQAIPKLIALLRECDGDDKSCCAAVAAIKQLVTLPMACRQILREDGLQQMIAIIQSKR